MGFIEKRNKIATEENFLSESVTKKKKGISKGQIIAIACILMIAGLTILVTSGIGNKNDISGTWVFAYYEDKDGDYRKDTEYDGIRFKTNYMTSVWKFNFKIDGVFIAECYEKAGGYSDYDEKKIKGEYEIDGNTINLTWGSSGETSFEFEKRGSDLIFANDSYGCYYYEKE